MESLIYSAPRSEGISPIQELRESLHLEEGEILSILLQKEEDGWVTLTYQVLRPLKSEELLRRYHV